MMRDVPPAAARPPEALSLDRIVVRAGRLSCEVSVAPGVPRNAAPHVAARVRAAFPHVAHHACVNGVGDTFAAVMEGASLPHLLEHLVIDLQTREAADPDAVYVGTSEWLDEAAGRARIEVNFTDDLVALRAFRDAVRFLNECVVP